MDSSPPPADSGVPVPKSRRRLAVVAVVGCLLLVAALVGRYLLLQEAANPTPIADPPPRPRLNAPFITSPNVIVDKMVEIAQLSKDDIVFDLGCGDGRIIVTAALKSGCQGIGFDIEPERVAEANKNVELHDVGRLVSIKEQDIFELDLSKADVAMMYLLPWMMQKLAPQFDQMKPGSRIVSHDFYIVGVEPDRVAQIFVGPNHDRHFVYLYTAPLRWNSNMPDRPPLQGILDRADAAKAAAEKAE
jgi:SAM-dependent methyltransferase